MLLPQGKAVIFVVFSSSVPPGHLLPPGKGPQADPCTARPSTNRPSQAGNAAGGTKTPELGNYRSNLTPVKAEEYVEWVSPEKYGLNLSSLCCSMAGLHSPRAVNLFHLLVKTVGLERCLQVQSTMLREAQGLSAPFSASGASGRRQDARSVLEDGTQQEHLCHEPSKSALALRAQLRQGERAGAVGSLNQKRSLLRKGPGGQKKGR